MSIVYCFEHDCKWDMDLVEKCPKCGYGKPCSDGACLVADARGEQYRCDGFCAYQDEPEAA